jgi:hypothetical protein
MTVSWAKVAKARLLTLINDPFTRENARKASAGPKGEQDEVVRPPAARQNDAERHKSHGLFNSG